MACEKCGCAINVHLCGDLISTISDGDDDGQLNVFLEQDVHDYTGDEPDPGIAAALLLPDPNNSSAINVLRVARNDEGFVTHIAVCGVWLPIGGMGDPGLPPGADTERVCYDVSEWDFSESFSAGCGQWIVNGQNLMTETCPETPFSVCPDSSLVATYGTGGNPSPSAGWDSLSWSAGGAGTTGCSGFLATDPPRQAIRWNFAGGIVASTQPQGNVVQYSFDYLTGDGTIIAGVYDPNSDTMVPITGFSKPSAAVVSLTQGASELFVHTTGNPLGSYTIDIDSTGYVLEDLELIVWQIGDGDSDESVGNPRVNYVAEARPGCFMWNTPSAVAAWMNSKLSGTGIAASFFANTDGEVCADVLVGVGGLFGLLEGCDESSTPSVVA